MTPNPSSPALTPEAEARELLAKITPGPWTLKLSEITHRINSPLCKDTCDQGRVPVEVRPDQEGELHVYLSDYAEDIIGADGTHVFCAGHDYDDGGLIATLFDAEFIAAAPRLLRALLDENRQLREDMKELDSLYNRDGVAQMTANQIETIFDRWNYGDST